MDIHPKNLVIDASNIRSGGGLTHLREILNESVIQEVLFTKVFVFAPSQTLVMLPKSNKIEYKPVSFDNLGYLGIFFWQMFVLGAFAKKNNALLYIPGTGWNWYPYVTMFRNLLPFQKNETDRYFLSKAWIRLKVLKMVQLFSFKNAKGIICLNQFCKDVLHYDYGLENSKLQVISHGLSDAFISKRLYDRKEGELKILYVSIVDEYKHQWNIVEVINKLRENGTNISLTLVGPAYPPSLVKLEKSLKYSDEKIKYLGKIDYSNLSKIYEDTDLFLFASTCETYGMVVTEAMGAGIPVLCSKYSSMPSNFLDSVEYFDPMNAENTEDKILEFYHDVEKCIYYSEKSKNFAATKKWTLCGKETFKYLYKIQEVCVE
tara:strand:- start:15189 stop:16313 length:1125 start_codon:yes stop_codon:yes gene_type:complete